MVGFADGADVHLLLTQDDGASYEVDDLSTCFIFRGRALALVDADAVLYIDGEIGAEFHVEVDVVVIIATVIIAFKSYFRHMYHCATMITVPQRSQ